MDSSSWVSTVLVVLTAAIIATHYYYKNVFKFWQSRGLAGPKPYYFLGNSWTTLADREAFTKWMKQFGKVYGIYESSKPALVVSDPAVITQICIKDFNKFPNHGGAEFDSELLSHFIFSSLDDHWRHIRAILSPTFTSGKMRRMFKLIDICADNMLEAMDERLKIGPVVNLKDLFSLYTMDAIASCCYGIRLMSYKGEASLTTAAKQDEFIRSAMNLFDFKLWRILVIMCLPDSILMRLRFGLISSRQEWAFARKIDQIIKKRQKAGKNFDDYLQTLIDSKLETNDETARNRQLEEDHLDAMEKHHAGADSDQSGLYGDEKLNAQVDKNKPLSDIEILANATFLLVVGLDTTSTLLTNCVYTLGFHQTIQEKLYQTIKTLAKKDDQGNLTFDYDSLTSCQYLDAVISEALRIQPPAPQTDRQAKEDYYLKSHDLVIPKGTRINIVLETMMKDADYWEKPDTFDPERFMPEQRHKIVSNSYCPFGVGPRHCLGMRFSLTESKVALAKLIIKYKFVPAPGTKYPPKSARAFGFFRMDRPEVTVSRRSED